MNDYDTIDGQATVKGRYEVNKSATTVATLTTNGGDVRLKASMTDATFVRGPSLNGLALSLEKPGAFILDYHIPTKVHHLLDPPPPILSSP
ncbi:hypothetical protein GW17_00059755 [Ensete ventricosum]|nr:hypothetical protein GW17_00059755 [Ensete ventricosum]RZS27245.1 hypothetical protein BHM03_00060686 [Ensete ventricosum]